MKKFGWVWALVAVALLALPAFAQEQTGSVVGMIKAEGDTGLPGVTVEIKGSGGTFTTVTDAKGEYRFPRVLPGAYKLTARLQGFQTYENSRVNVSLGDRVTVNVSMRISSVQETVVVTGERVQIALGENSTAAVIGGEQLALLPKGRDFTTVVTQASGVSNEAFLGGLSVDGASGSENRFVIDGVDTTQPQDGLSGQNFVTDFLEEVQVKSAGYAAEFGGALGGVINAVTKSGTNEFSGWVGTYYTNSSLNGDARPTYGESYPGYYKTFEKDDLSRWEPGFGLGGPIVKDNLWFYLGYNPTLSAWDRTPDQSTSSYAQDITTHYFTGNLKANISSKLIFKLSANITNRKQEGILPNLDGSTPAGADLSVDTKVPTNSYSLYADWVPTSAFYVTGRLGHWDTDTQTTGVDATNRMLFRNGVIPVPTTDPRYRPTGFSTVPAASFNNTDFDEWKRNSAGMDFNVFANFLGSHAFKAGVQYEKIENAVSTGENGNYFEVRWGLADRFGMGVKGTYGSVGVRRFRTEGAAESTNIGLYVQDTWTVHPTLTLNIGVRTEQERVPNYGAQRDPTLPQYAMEFDFSEKVAPRIGFSWDVAGKQKMKVYGSYGTYYDITKLEMPRGSFGADRWVQSMYQLNTLDWATIPVGCATVDNSYNQNPCPHLKTAGNGVYEYRDLRLPTPPDAAHIDPDLKPMENREFQFGLDYQLTKNAVLSARYVNKSLQNTIEDIGFLNAEGNEEYITGNPGKGVVACKPDTPFPCPQFPQAEAVRDYQAIELSYAKRFSDNWSLRAAYTYSKLSGNYSGLASSDEFGRTDPNVARYFDGLVYGYDSSGSIVDGVLNTDRPHAIEIQALYRMPWATTVGLNYSWFAGGPVSTDTTYNGVNFFPNGRNDMGRLSSIQNFDLMLAHPFQIGKMQLEASINVLNLFDSMTITRVGNNKYQADVCDVRADCDTSNAWYFGDLVPYSFDQIMTAGGATLDPAYGNALAWQAPREVRFALKLMF